MRRLNGLPIWLASVAVALLAACSSLSSSPSETIYPEITPGPLTTNMALVKTTTDSMTRSSSADQSQNAPTPTPNSASSLQVRIWWPDNLYPAENTLAADTLLDQFQSFTQTYASYELDIRRKRANGLGGILPMLRSAESVAPGVIPHLTLMQRADMVTAASEGLIYPLDSWIPSDIVEGLLPGIRSLGEINGLLYGVPYALNFRHMVYRTSTFEAPLVTFADVLAQQPAYQCPAATTQTNSVNWTLLLQYLEAGGRLTDESGQAVLDREPLLAVLEYYEAGTTTGIFGPDLLLTSQYDAYWNDFAAGTSNLVCVDAITYLTHRNGIQGIDVTSLPTLDGAPITNLEGWMWVLTTQVPDAQTQARAFLLWMMRASQHSRFSEALGIIPSSERALLMWDDVDYARFAERMLASGVIVSNSERNSNAGVAMQEAFAAVLEGETAATAIERVDSVQQN